MFNARDFFNHLKTAKRLRLAGMFGLMFSSGLFAADETLVINGAEKAEVGQLLAVPKDNAYRMSIQYLGQTLQMELQVNTSLLGDSTEGQDSTELLLLKGQLSGVDNSWVRLSVNNGVYSGAYFDGNELYFIDPANQVTNHLPEDDVRNRLVEAGSYMVYPAEQVQHDGLCAVEPDPQTAHQGFDYQEFVDELNVLSSTAASKQIKLALVADTQFNAAFGGNGLSNMLTIMNVVDGIFSEQVGVQLTVDKTRVLTDNGDLTSTDALTLLRSFRTYVNQEIGNPGLSHLFTGRNLNGSTAGIAYLNTMCSSYGVGLSQRTGSVTALIAAHELGHNFGAPHDNQSSSACSSTGGGFLMNPSINGSDTFSACSLNQMAGPVNNASCMVDNDVVAPRITSSASLVAQVGAPYQYDLDSQVESSGTGPITYELDFGPDGMTVSSNGSVSWTPSAGQVGSHPVQITASNSVGSDSQLFDIEVSDASDDGSADTLNFNNNSVLSYAGSQDVQSNISVEQNGAALRMTGNTWKRIALPYNVTPATVLEFDFSSSSRGEIHGIGLDNDNGISSDKTFNLFGSQSWGRTNFSYSGNGAVQRFVIPVGQFYTGSMSHLFFVMDHDVANPSGENLFSNVRVYDKGSSPSPSPSPSPSLDFNNFELSAYATSQDVTGTVEILDGGTTLRLEGNKWQKIRLPTNITRDTVLEFDFLSTAQGEVHGIGFDNDNSLSENRTFKLYGSQNWGRKTVTYTNVGSYQRFTIPVGQYYTGQVQYLYFVMDHDVSSPNGVSQFRNISIR